MENSNEAIEVLSEFSCTLCDEQFNKLKDVEKHIITFHQITSKIYIQYLIEESKIF